MHMVFAHRSSEPDAFIVRPAFKLPGWQSEVEHLIDLVRGPSLHLGDVEEGENDSKSCKASIEERSV